jgi:hypothetical protein
VDDYSEKIVHPATGQEVQVLSGEPLAKAMEEFGLDPKDVVLMDITSNTMTHNPHLQLQSLKEYFPNVKAFHYHADPTAQQVV